MLIDSHCHLDLLDLTNYTHGLRGVLQEAQENNVTHILCPGVTLTDFSKVLKIAIAHENVSCSIGLHPSEKVAHEPSIEEIMQLIEQSNSDKIVGIGETGLDYHYEDTECVIQQQRFRNHIRVALATNKPLIIHSREAQEDMIRILREEQAAKVGGVMHCFTEDWGMAQRVLELGFYISLSGIVTFKQAVKLQEVARKMPIERMLLETDAPWLAPVPVRGKSNVPAYLHYIAEYVANLRGISCTELAMQTTNNFEKCFKIKAKS